MTSDKSTGVVTVLFSAIDEKGGFRPGGHGQRRHPNDSEAVARLVRNRRVARRRAEGLHGEGYPGDHFASGGGVKVLQLPLQKITNRLAALLSD